MIFECKFLLMRLSKENLILSFLLVFLLFIISALLVFNNGPFLILLAMIMLMVETKVGRENTEWLDILNTFSNIDIKDIIFQIHDKHRKKKYAHI